MSSAANTQLRMLAMGNKSLARPLGVVLMVLAVLAPGGMTAIMSSSGIATTDATGTTTTTKLRSIVGNASAAACLEAPTPGKCGGRHLRYAYKPETGTCVSMDFSSCPGTANHFLTFEECRRDCMQKMRY